MPAQTTAASQGRAQRPWEPWHSALTLGPIGAASAVALGFVVAIWLHRVGDGLLVVLAGIVAMAASVAYRRLMRERLVMWRRLDAAITKRDREWRARRPPRVTRRDRGLVVIVRPVPNLTPQVLEDVLSAVANQYGLQLVTCQVEWPLGYVRSMGRERLRIELSR